MKTIHLFRNGNIEVGCTVKRRPSYRWAQGYSEATKDGYSAPLTLKNWRGMASRDGHKVKVHASEDSARAAI
jgi:hypothetical protein